MKISRLFPSKAARFSRPVLATLAAVGSFSYPAAADQRVVTDVVTISETESYDG